ncbi:MAG: hypothetical protein JF606_18965 [Burkholderiales bacterium]|nr:hypothetical protein [Burkholderiales bacterium]
MPDVPLDMDTMKVRKALTAMSICAVSTSWLMSVAGLSRRQLAELLRTLEQQMVLLGPFDCSQPAMQVPPQQKHQHWSTWKEVRDFLKRQVSLEGWCTSRLMRGTSTMRDRSRFFHSSSFVDQYTSPWVESDAASLPTCTHRPNP